nr:hypothetical protein [Tanacetum cinerariifolium]
MNEQLIVKNFGPIKDATVDFKRVTVFIGPTYRQLNSFLQFTANSYTSSIDENLRLVSEKRQGAEMSMPDEAAARHDLKLIAESLVNTVENLSNYNTIDLPENIDEILDNNREKLLNAINKASKLLTDNHIHHFISSLSTYITSGRSVIPLVEYSWAGLLKDNIGLPKEVLEFANNFSLSRKNVFELDIDFLKIKYFHRSGQDFIKTAESETLFRLYETASGIQSVTPLLVLLEHLSRNTEQAQSFIIEEPELNLYPTAQQGPYILSHLNLLLYAYQVAEKHPDRREAVAAIVPEASWINPKEFACYQVENGGVQSLVDEELGLIDNNELDGLSERIRAAYTPKEQASCITALTHPVFHVYDPLSADDTGTSTRLPSTIRLGPEKEDRELTVRNITSQPIHLVAIDCCLFASDDPSRCDCALVRNEIIHFVEFKHGNFRRRTERVQECVKQLAKSINDFYNTGIIPAQHSVLAIACVGFTEE